MEAAKLKAELETAGELMVTVEEFDFPLELHLHDTEFGEDEVELELADGSLSFALDSVTGYWTHNHSLQDYGLE